LTDGSDQIPKGCAEGASDPMAVDGGLRPGGCSNVAWALRDLLEQRSARASIPTTLPSWLQKPR